MEQAKTKLLELRSELQALEHSAKTNLQAIELDQSRVGRLSRMDAMQRHEMALETSRRRQQQLQKLESALRRIESDDYGYCFVCDETISLDRLMIDPSNTRCIRCASA